MPKYKSPFRKQTLRLSNSVAWAVKERLEEYPPGSPRRLKDFVELAVRNEVTRQVEKLELVDRMLEAEAADSQDARDKISKMFAELEGHKARKRMNEALAYTHMLLARRGDRAAPDLIDAPL